MADTSTRITADFSAVIDALDSVDAALLDTVRNFGKVGEAAKKASSEVSASFKVGAAQGIADALDGLQKEYSDLKRSSDVLKAAHKNAFDPAAVKLYTQSIKILDDEIERVEKSARAAGVKLKDVTKIGEGGTSFAGLTKFAGAAAGVFALLQGGSQVVQATREFERLFATLKQVKGNELEAQKVFADIQQFAAETPFQLNELVDAFVKLENRNFNPTIDQLRTIGDIAASQGKSVNQFVEAILDAQTGEFERLKEFGIVARKQGDDLKVSFRGQSEVIDNTADSITKYLLKIGELPGVQGSAIAVSKTLDGSLSNLQDNFTRLFSTIGGSGGVLKAFVDGINSVVSGFNEMVSTPLSDTLRQQQIEFNALIGVLQDTTVEETQRNEVIGILKKEYPGYLKFVGDDAKGQLDLARTLQEGNKQFEARILLQATEEKRVELTRKQVELQQQLTQALIDEEKATQRLAQRANTPARNEAGDIGGTENVTAAAQRRVQSVRDQIETVRTEIEDLIKVSDATAIRTTGKSIAALQADLTVSGEKAKTVSETIGAANKKAVTDTADLARLRASVLKDGLEQEIALENARYVEQRNALQKAFAGREELYGILQQAEQRHQEAIGQIQAKYYLEQALARRAALDAEKELVAQGLAELGELETQERARLLANAKRNEDAQKNAAELEKELFEAALLTSRELFFEKKRTDAEVQEYEKNVAKLREVFQLEQQAAELQRTLDFGKELSDAEKAILEQRIENIRTQIGQIQAGVGEQKGGKRSSFLSLFGLDPNDPSFESDLQKLKTAAAETIAAIQSIAAARVDSARQIVEAANTELSIAEEKTDKAKQELEDEKDLQEQGFASNVALKEKELQEAEKQEGIKKAQRDKALQDQQKAQKAQLIIDSAQQASNIAVSVSNLIKTWSNIPFGLGLVLAFAQAATIVAFMANIRNQAKAISGQKFRHGGSGYVTENGLIIGPSHQAGGVHFEAEGGEIVQVGDDGGRRRLSVVKRERVRDYFDLLDAANRNDKDAMREHALNLAGPDSDYTLPYMSVGEGMTPDAVEIDRGAVQKHLFGESGKEPQDNRQIEELRRSNQLLEKMLRVMLSEKDREQWTPDGKTRIRGNTRTTFIN